MGKDDDISKRPSAGDRTKASKLRKRIAAGEELRPIDKLWLADYEHHHPGKGKEPDGAGPEIPEVVPTARPNAAARALALGASSKGRKVSATFDLEEQAQSLGVGESAATLAALGALQERESGQRLDTLTVNALKVYEKCVLGWEKMGTVCRRLLRESQRANIELMRSLRGEYMKGLQVEGTLRQMQAREEEGGDPLDALMAAMAARYAGIDPEQIKAAGQLVKPGKNGAGKPKH
jgi:hypothetical protein